MHGLNVNLQVGFRCKGRQTCVAKKFLPFRTRSARGTTLIASRWSSLSRTIILNAFLSFLIVQQFSNVHSKTPMRAITLTPKRNKQIKNQPILTPPQTPPDPTKHIQRPPSTPKQNNNPVTTSSSNRPLPVYCTTQRKLNTSTSKGDPCSHISKLLPFPPFPPNPPITHVYDKSSFFSTHTHLPL